MWGYLRPYVEEWFKERFREPTEPQRQAIPLIKKGENVLISSPTGTGKTLAAFLGIIDELFKLGEEGRLEEAIYAVYVSPLRALNNDMNRNLREPLNEIREYYVKKVGKDPPEIRVAVRTSDTPPNERQAMLRKPPHILITTPETLSIILVAPRFRERLRTVRWVIVDEIHEMATSKRGANLSLLLERLEWLAGRRIQRIGLSATIAPLDRIARFLGGYNDDGSPRPVSIVDARFYKPVDIKVIAPKMSLVYADTDKLNESIYKTIVELVKKHRSTLIFTNTRSATERVVYKLKKLMEKDGLISMDEIEAHHSSLSRDLRLDVEKKLKEGKLRVVVSSTSLELGIDIGYIDLVILLSSPKSVSRLLQRVGRAGHRIKEVSKGRIIVVDRDDLVECSVLADAARKRIIDRAKIPRNPLDVLAQNLIAMSLEQRWRVEDAYRLVKRSYVFHTLPYEDFLRVLEFLGGIEEGLEDMRVYSKLWYDPEEGVFGRKRNVRMIYYLNQGMIPDEAKMRVFLKGKNKYIGDLEEEFVQILSPGDIFVLGGRTYRFIRSEGIKVIVESAEGLRPTVPSWFSEMLPLAFDSALLVGRTRREISERLQAGQEPEKVIEWIRRRLMLQKHAARELVEYIREQMLFTNGIVASDKTIHVEIYDDARARNIIFHSLFGRRTNDALSRAFALVLTRMVGAPVRVTVSDNAFMLTVAGHPDINVDELLEQVNHRNVRSLLEKAIWNTELMKRRFRHCAQRAFMILRNYRGWERSPHRMQLSAQSILEALKDNRDHPIIRETLREIMEDYMDVEAAETVLRWVDEGKLGYVVTYSANVPSPFAHHIIAIGYQDIVLMEDRRKLLMELHRKVMNIISSESAGRKDEALT